MSTRQLKKLHKQQELLRLQNLANDEDASSEEEVAPSKPRASAFAGFAALGGDDNNEDAEQDEDDEESQAQPELAAPAPAPAKKNKKSKKKRKAKKAAAALADEGKPKDIGLDEIDLALKELSMKPASASAAEQSTQGTYDAKLARLLSISFDHLKVINELRAMFGQETIDSVRHQDEAQARDDRRRTRRGQHVHIDMETFLKGKPGEKIPEVVLRKNPFVQGKEYWPRASAGGLKMEAVTDERVEPTEYTFTHDRAYLLLEMQFFSLVDMMDPMRIVHFVHENPYHANALIQTSRVAKQDSNAALAGDLCERALFTFGRVTLSSFRKKLERGLARLDFRRPENRQFWLAGYHYIKSLMQKGTYDTALEWTKLFLSLSPNDEYAMMNFTHVLAIYAYEAKWLIALCDSAYFNSDEYDLPMKEYHRQTCVLARLQLGDKEGAMKALVKGMETLPWLYSAICSAVNIDTPRPVWGVTPRDEKDSLYTELYIHMAKDIWKRDGIQLLKEAGERASKVDPSSLPFATDVPLSIGRFIYLDNTPDLMGLVPSRMLHASPNFDYDPLPPPMEENIFSSEWQRLPWRHDDAGSQRTSDSVVEEMMQVARQLARERRAQQGTLEDEPEDGEDRASDEEVINIANDSGFLSTLARLLLPVWMPGTNAAQNEADAMEEDILEQILGEVAEADGQNPWLHDSRDTEDEMDSEEEMPALIPLSGDDDAQDGNASGQDNQGSDEDTDDMPPLEPLS